MLFSTTTASPPSPPATGHFSEDKARGPASGEEPEEEKFFLDRTLREQAPEVFFSFTCYTQQWLYKTSFIQQRSVQSSEKETSRIAAV